MTVALELRRVSKTYGSGATEVHALREVDLTDCLAFMGQIEASIDVAELQRRKHGRTPWKALADNR